MPVGLSYYAEENVISIFGAEGEETSNGLWAENTGPYGSTSEHLPDSRTLEELNAKLEKMVSTGRGDKIAQVRLGRREAVHLFLEKALRPEHFAQAYEENGCIIIPRMQLPYSKIGGLWFIVGICITTSKRGVVLLDDNGQILKLSHSSKAEDDLLLATFEPDLIDGPDELSVFTGVEGSGGIEAIEDQSLEEAGLEIVTAAV